MERNWLWSPCPALLPALLLLAGCAPTFWELMERGDDRGVEASLAKSREGVDLGEALGYSVRRGDERMVRVLLKAGAPASPPNQARAAMLKNGRVLRTGGVYTWQFDPDRSEPGCPVLVDAIFGGHASVVTALLEAGADANLACAGWGVSAACGLGLARVYAPAGSRVRLNNGSGGIYEFDNGLHKSNRPPCPAVRFTPLSLAERIGRADVVAVLLSHGASKREFADSYRVFEASIDVGSVSCCTDTGCCHTELERAKGP